MNQIEEQKKQHAAEGRVEKQRQQIGTREVARVKQRQRHHRMAAAGLDPKKSG